MKRVTGIGGIFFKAKQPKKLLAWYGRHLGMKRASRGRAVVFHWREAGRGRRQGLTLWAPFPRDTEYFKPSRSPFMLNFRVANLDRLLATLQKEGVRIEPRHESSRYGRFAWIIDPEGNKLELWEPPAPAHSTRRRST